MHLLVEEFHTQCWSLSLFQLIFNTYEPLFANYSRLPTLPAKLKRKLLVDITAYRYTVVKAYYLLSVFSNIIVHYMNNKREDYTFSKPPPYMHSFYYTHIYVTHNNIYIYVLLIFRQCKMQKRHLQLNGKFIEWLFD